MKNVLKLTLLFILIITLVLFVIFRFISAQDGDTEQAENTPEPEETVEPDPEAEYFTFNFVGDNTLAGIGYESTTGGNADYPYANTKEFLDGAEFNFANLECIYSDAPLYSDTLFHFKSPTKNTAMLTWAGIDFVTTANNHTLDYGQRGLDDTVSALEDAGIAYGLDGKTAVFETENGIKIGIYCGFQYVTERGVVSAINSLKSENVDLIMCAFHWGTEGAYHPTAMQTSLAHAAIDAGADFVYGSHPHVLQPFEEYNGGYIIYSLANWSFGGNSRPADMDTAIVQLTVMRSPEGKVSIAGYKLIPCCVSSVTSYNDYCPTPYEKGTADYDRCMSKLLGTFTGPDLVVDYSGLRPHDTDTPENPDNPEPTEAPEPTDVPQPTPDAEIPEVPVPDVTE